MGVSSTGLFADDVACEIRDDYIARLRSGLTGRQATKELLADRSEELADDDDGPVIWLALAVTQWKYGRLEPRVKSRALNIIKTGKGLARWRELSDPALVKQRQRILDKLRTQLESPQPEETNPGTKKWTGIYKSAPDAAAQEITTGQLARGQHCRDPGRRKSIRLCKGASQLQYRDLPDS
jgi:hypothetical protein